MAESPLEWPLLDAIVELATKEIKVLSKNLTGGAKLNIYNVSL